MTSIVNKDEASSDAACGEFRIGNYVLHLHRSYDQTRLHLGLSQREFELLLLVCSGFRKHEIAKRMGVTPATADTFRRRAYNKLGVKSGSAAVAIVSAHLAGTDVSEQPAI